MTWKLFLMTGSIVIFLFTLGVGLAEPVLLASAIAPRLALELDGDEQEIRDHIRSILGERVVWRTAVYSAPWALLTLLLIARVIAELASAFRSGWKGEVES